MQDKELEDFEMSMSEKEFNSLMNRIWCRTYRQSSRRNSGLDYVNSKEKLAFIKDKYKNGVTNDILNEILSL